MTLKSIFERIINHDITTYVNLIPIFAGMLIWYWIGKKYSKNRDYFNISSAGVIVLLIITDGGLRDLAKMSFENRVKVITLAYICLAYSINLIINKLWPTEGKPLSKKSSKM